MANFSERGGNKIEFLLRDQNIKRSKDNFLSKTGVQIYILRKCGSKLSSQPRGGGGLKPPRIPTLVLIWSPPPPEGMSVPQICIQLGESLYISHALHFQYLVAHCFSCCSWIGANTCPHQRSCLFAISSALNIWQDLRGMLLFISLLISAADGRWAMMEEGLCMVFMLGYLKRGTCLTRNCACV